MVSSADAATTHTGSGGGGTHASSVLPHTARSSSGTSGSPQHLPNNFPSAADHSGSHVSSWVNTGLSSPSPFQVWPAASRL